MNLAQVRRYRAWAKSCTQDSQQHAEIMLELCEEIERLQGVTDEKHGAFTNYTLMPWGAHKGKKLGDIEDDYFVWLQRKHPDRGVVGLDAQFGSFQKKRTAEQILKLLDYAARRFGDSSDNTEGQE